MSFGENLRYYRKQKKLTQEQLADLIDAKHIILLKYFRKYYTIVLR